MKRTIIVFGIIVIFLAIIFFSKFSVYGNKMAKVRMKGSVFRAETVVSDSKKEKGLGGRKKLCKDCSMLFIFSRQGYWEFWMKEMNFNLDIVWIDGNRIIKIEKNVDKNSKNKIYPESPADKVLELNSGIADEKGIEIGDLVEIEY